MSGRWADRPHGRTLPPDWGRTRRRILRRDPHCTLQDRGCTQVSTEVDHIGDPDEHHDSNLRGVCHPCHTKRTARQAAAGRAEARARRPRNRPTEPHPGLLPTNTTEGWGVTPNTPTPNTGTA